jgi:hypothetical protein
MPERIERKGTSFVWVLRTRQPDPNWFGLGFLIYHYETKSIPYLTEKNQRIKKNSPKGILQRGL